MFSSAGIAETYLEKLGIDIVLANELVPERAKYYSHFYPKVDMVVGDIMEKKVFSTYLQKAKSQKPRFLLATPPCQGMSSLGKKDYVKDERNYLIFSVLKVIDALDLDVVVIENVPVFKRAVTRQREVRTGLRPDVITSLVGVGNDRAAGRRCNGDGRFGRL